MKKSLLLATSALALSALSASAFVVPTVYEANQIMKVSPDGRYAMSEVYGTAIIYDFVENKSYTYEADETGAGPYYSAGLGNCISNNGIVLMATSSLCDAAYWDNGQIKNMPVTGATGVNNLANGITPDGARACGSLGVHEMGFDDATMLVPVIWDRLADGSYGDYVLLPRPEKDFFDRVPQYITANAISRDGKVVVGQVVDCSGMYITPIVYTEGADGKWSYALPAKQFFNPDNIELPVDPGEAPASPNATDFMTEEQKEAYEAAYDAWVGSGYAGEMPNAEDYLSPEALAEYAKAKEEYEAKLAEWAPLSDAWFEAFYAIVQTSVRFEFNNIFISSDGKHLVTSAITEVEDPESWMGFSTLYVPWDFNLADATITKYVGEESLKVTDVADNGIILASNGPGSLPTTSYILQNGEVKTIAAYLTSLSPELATWIKDNMTQVVEEYDFDTEEFVDVEYVFTGLPFATPDMSTLFLTTDTPWNYAIGFITYKFDLSEYGGVAAITPSVAAKVAFDAAGNLCLGEGVVRLDVYNLSGACVLSAANPASTIACDLQKGIYLVKTTAADGTVAVAKLAR